MIKSRNRNTIYKNGRRKDYFFNERGGENPAAQ